MDATGRELVPANESIYCVADHIFLVLCCEGTSEGYLSTMPGVADWIDRT
jgi:hypothetical protein